MINALKGGIDHVPLTDCMLFPNMNKFVHHTDNIRHLTNSIRDPCSLWGLGHTDPH